MRFQYVTQHRFNQMLVTRWLQIEANRAPKSQPSQQSQVKQVLLTIIGTSNWCSSLVVYTNGVGLSAKSANVFAHLFLVLPIDDSLKSLIFDPLLE